MQSAADTAAQRYSPRPLTDGERWTSRELALLRRRRYRPRAWAAFITSALERSRESGRAQRHMVRQARRWGIFGGVSWLGACVATRSRPTEIRLHPVAGLLWWLSVWQMLDWHLGMAERGDGSRRTSLAPADAVTLSRFWMVPLLLGCARSERGLPLVIGLGGATDWVDGRLARRRGRTRLGRDLDTTADLAFLTAAAVAARRQGSLSQLGYTAVLSRQAIGVLLASGAVLLRARRPAVRARPWGAFLRVGGLLACSVGSASGEWLVVLGCCVPPRSTASQLSPA